jgi:hypothetical protein
MKKAIIFFAIILSGCVTQPDQAPQQCPQIGVNPQAPDFSQKHTQQEIDSFYNCQINTTPERLFNRRSVIGALFQGDMTPRKDLRFQWNLFRQILAKEKTPTQAQEAWMVWQNQNRGIEASEDAASAAANQSQNNSMPHIYNCTTMGGMTTCN